jgi:nucleotide-binding universal stress UspA family protein
VKRILLAYDGGEPARRALYLVATLAHAVGASVTVVSVAPRRFLDLVLRAPVPGEEQERRNRLLQEADHVLRLRGIEPDLIESAGDPAEAIVRTATDGAYDTVVLGAHPGLAPDRSGLCGIPRRVAMHTRATVVIAR